MKGTLIALGFALLLPAIAAAEPAKLPNPEACVIPCGICLVGTTAGVDDARGAFSITIRDFANNPVAGSSVLIDFSGCAPDIHVCSVQTGAAGVNCSLGPGFVYGVTDMTGMTTMCIVGGAHNAGTHTGGADFQCAAIYADGVQLGHVNVAAFDEDGSSGVNPTDASMWFSDGLDYPGAYRGRSDYDCSHSVTPADLSILMQASLDHRSLNSCSAYCN